MERRSMLQSLLALVASPMLTRRAYAAEGTTAPDFPPISKSEQQWKALLEPARYQILFEEGTERPFSSPLNNEKHAGTFVCAACFLPLFDSDHKFDSGTGWPSFTQPIAGHIGTKKDYKLVLPRTEYHYRALARSSGPRLQRRACTTRGTLVQQRPGAVVRYAKTTLPALQELNVRTRWRVSRRRARVGGPYH
jgi:peptide-methionine (R)-S-oxide reductase